MGSAPSGDSLFSGISEEYTQGNTIGNLFLFLLWPAYDPRYLVLDVLFCSFLMPEWADNFPPQCFVPCYTGLVFCQGSWEYFLTPISRGTRRGKTGRPRMGSSIHPDKELAEKTLTQLGFVVQLSVLIPVISQTIRRILDYLQLFSLPSANIYAAQ